MELSRTQAYTNLGQRFAWAIHYLKAKYRNKEQDKVSQLAPFIPYDGVIFDIGAHFGYFAKEFCTIHHGSCFVYCFEPLSYCFSVLLPIMGLYTNKRLENIALSDRNCIEKIYIPVKPSRRLGIGLAHFGEEKFHDYVIEFAETITLDDYFARQGLSRLDFIKCDVEGAELHALRGGEVTISKYKPGILCEIDNSHTCRLGYDAQDIVIFLAQLGYRAYLFHEDGVRQPVEQYEKPGDYLFLAQ